MNKQINIRTYRLLLYTLVVQFGFVVQVFCQTDIPSEENTSIMDTVVGQSTAAFDTVSLQFDEDALDEIINYSASDSIVYDIANEMLYLYGDAFMEYDDFTINSEMVTFDWAKSTLVSEGMQDSSGTWYGTPVFTQAGTEYEAHKMEYSFKTNKGKTYDVYTEQEEAYIHSEVVKKNEYDEWYGHNTRYTTCDNKDHPHFYIEAKKSKVVPDEVMVTGPANLVIGGVNTPLYLPFAIFPTKKEKPSGILFPEFGEQNSRGFFLNGLGYFWSVNDRLGIALTNDIDTKGNFRVGTQVLYNKRYKFDGNFIFDYARTAPDDKLVSKAGLSNVVNIEWRHQMDSKAKPNHSFRANVDGQSSGYNDGTFITDQNLLTVGINSSINYTRRFSGKPYTFSINASHNQNLTSREVRINAPEFVFNITRFTPFQPKIKTPKKKFYQNIGFTYEAKAKTFIEAIDSTFLKKETLQNIQYGAVQRATVNAPVNLFKFFTVTPRFEYNERWYFKEEDRIWDPDTSYLGILDTITNEITGIDTIVTDKVKEFQEGGFYDVRDFNFQTSISTVVTGIYNFKGKKLKAIRHIIKPSLSYRFQPDFKNERWGYWDTYFDEESQEEVSYNRYQFLDNLYGAPGGGLQNVVSFNMTNNFEMKVLNKKDTTKEYKNIPLLENLTFSTGYNFSADSLKMQPISINATSSLFNRLLTFNFRSVFSIYNKNENNTRINESVWAANKRLLRMESIGFNFNLNLSPKMKEKQEAPTRGVINELEYNMFSSPYYGVTNEPWSLRLGYSMNIVQGAVNAPDSILINANALTLSGQIKITPKWDVNLSTGYNFRDKDVTLTNVQVVRNLHCWQLAFNWTAYPLNRQTYSIDLHVLASQLEQLKLSRKEPIGNLTGDF